jgi:hypothetical protein
MKSLNSEIDKFLLIEGAMLDFLESAEFSTFHANFGQKNKKEYSDLVQELFFEQGWHTTDSFYWIDEETTVDDDGNNYEPNQHGPYSLDFREAELEGKKYYCIEIWDGSNNPGGGGTITEQGLVILKEKMKAIIADCSE